MCRYQSSRITMCHHRSLRITMCRFLPLRITICHRRLCATSPRRHTSPHAARGDAHASGLVTLLAARVLVASMNAAGGVDIYINIHIYIHAYTYIYIRIYIYKCVRVQRLVWRARVSATVPCTQPKQYKNKEQAWATAKTLALHA